MSSQNPTSSFGKAIQFSKIGITSFAIGKINKDAGRRYRLRELGNLPGIPAKMGQILTMKFGADLETENKTPAPMSLDEVKSIIQKEAPLLLLLIETISSQPITASIGQVHQATLTTGETVAIKIRYPDIERDIEQQLKLVLGSMSALPTPDAFKIDNEEYSSFLNGFFSEEINYLKEAKSQNAFHNAWSNDYRFVIPMVYLELGSKSVLVQSYEQSLRISQISDFTQKEKIYYSECLKDFFLKGVLDFGLIHTDLHAKNWGFRREKAQIVFYDFGATLQLSTELRLTLLKLSSLDSNNSTEYLDLLVLLGFNRRKLLPIKDQLKDLCALLFEPIRNKDQWKPSQWNLQQRINDLLGEYKWNFRTSGPPWFLMLIRGLNGWLDALKHLEPLTEIQESEPLIKTKLKIKVIENGYEKVYLELPATSLIDLEVMIPNEVLDTIRAKGISVSEIRDFAIRNGYNPQLLFEASTPSKSYKVWLE
jgi:predicted unusual protein kinase regulating ubiquinone biosynthesis (AarF/ABC1/UbiB family)